MKVDKVGFKAVIPTGQYANIQPEIEFSDCGVGEATEVGMSYIKDLFARFSEKGGLTDKDIILSSVTKKSFNEGVEVQFEPIHHTYSIGSVPLIGATNYIKKFYKEFDVETMSGVSAKSWGVNQQDVKDLWESNGDLTSMFGTVVHNALEQYENFRAMGSTVQAKKELPDNYAMPRHPILKKIVEEFALITSGNDSKWSVVPEALITDVGGGFCGTADRILILDQENKICRVQDYKVNINSDEIKKSMKALTPFDTLPANKITKYQIQMSFYANMLQKSGWTVEGLDVFIYEDEWKTYHLNVLEVI